MVVLWYVSYSLSYRNIEELLCFDLGKLHFGFFQPKLKFATESCRVYKYRPVAGCVVQLG